MAAPNAPDIHGDWEIAYNSVKDESAWQLRVTPETASNPAQVRAVIQRIDGDTGSLYGVGTAKIYTVSHFTAAGPLLYSLHPAAGWDAACLQHAARRSEDGSAAGPGRAPSG